MSKIIREEEQKAYKLLLPTFIIMLVVAVYPLYQVFYTSLTDRKFAGTGEVNFIGLENYRDLIGLTILPLPVIYDEHGDPMIDATTGKKEYVDAIEVLPMRPRRYREILQFQVFGTRYVLGGTNRDFIISIYNTLLFTVVAVSLETLLGLIIALVVNSAFIGRGIMRAIMLVPWAVITVVSARIWEWMLHPTRIGLFNTLLDHMGMIEEPIAFLTLNTYRLPALIAADVWKTTPFMALLILAGLQMIPKEIYEASCVDGASRVRQLFSITLPLLKPTIAVALIFRTLDSLRVFDLFQVIMGSQTYSMASYNYYQLLGNRNMGLASAISLYIFLLISIFAILYFKLLGVEESDHF